MMQSQVTWFFISMVDFNKHLMTIRKDRQLTQAELAGLLDVQPRIVGRWEQGTGKPQFDYIIRLSQVLEVSLDYLLLGQEGQSSPTFDVKNKRLKELCKRVDHLKKDDQEVICHFLDLAVKHEKVKELINTAV